MSVIIDEKTNEEITAEMLSQVPDTYQKNAGYFIWDFLRAISFSFESLWAKLSYLTGFFDISKLDYDDLVKFVLQRRGIVAKTATYATGILNVTGTGTITTGDLFETTSGLQFQASETKAITTSGTVQIECVTSGSDGNVPINSITVIPTTIQGITAVTNSSATSGGYDAETKENLLERYMDDIQKPITSGNVNHYQKWAKEVNGVGKVKVKPLWDGDNTVKVVIIDSNGEIPTTTLVNSVQAYIDPYTLNNGVKVGWGCGNGQAPIGAYCTVVAADQLDIDVSVEIELMTGAVLATVEDNIEKAIKAYLKSTNFSASYVSYAQIGAAILSADGVKDYTNLLVNNDTDNVAITDTNTSSEIAVLNDLTITEQE